MPNQVITADTIVVHGRGSLSLPYQVKNATGTRVDISGWNIIFEVDGVPISTALVADPNDAQGLLIELTRAQIATLKTKATRFAVIDVRNETKPVVLWEGTIRRSGYAGDPDAVDDPA